MKTAVVTGATSFIGVHLIDELLERGYRVAGVVRPGSANSCRLSPHSNLDIIQLALEDIKRLPERLDKADVFLHLAWEGARMPHRDNRELQRHNLHGAVAAMEAAAVLRCHTFVGAGSQAEYGRRSGPVDESCLCCPTTEYGKAKLEAFQQLQGIASNRSMRLLWPRIFSIYGPHDFEGTLVMSALRRMLEDETIEMTSCTQFWDYLYVSDAARAIATLCEVSGAQGVYHIADGRCRPLREFIREMKEIVGSRSQLHFGAIPYGAEGPVDLRPVALRIRQDTGWKPHTAFREGILNTARVLKAHEKN